MTLALPPVLVMLPGPYPRVPLGLFMPFDFIVLNKMYVLILDLCTFVLIKPKLYKKLYAWSCHPKHGHSCVFDQNCTSQMYSGSHLSEFVAKS